MHGGPGYEWNEKSQRCRRDSVNRLYPVDKYGGRIVRRKQDSSRPEHIPSYVWWKDYSPLDRLERHKTMKEREKEEAPKMAAIVAMTAARSNFDANESNNDKVEEIVPASGRTSSPAVRACNPVYLNRKQGTAGLFEDCNKVIVHEDSDSEVSTSIASPATLNDLDEESDPSESIGRSIEEEIEQEFNICATARLIPANLDEDFIPAMPCTAKINEAPHRPRVVASQPTQLDHHECMCRSPRWKEGAPTKQRRPSVHES